MYKVFILLAALVLPSSLKALVVNIDSSDFQALPIAILGFDNEKVSGKDTKTIESIIKSDLDASFVFRAVRKTSFLKNTSLTEEKQNLLSEGFLFAVTGSTYRTRGSDIIVRFELHDLVEDKIVLSYSYTASKSAFKEQLRYIAHDIANEIYKDFTLEDSFFSSKILYVEDSSIKMADFDFKNVKTVYKNKDSILINPKISPDEKKVVFLEINKNSGLSSLSIYDMQTGKIENIKHEAGTVLSPSFSADGKKLLFSIAKDRSANIYEFNFNTRAVLKVTNSYSINVSPSYWTKDPKQIIFTSDRHGQPQLFTIKAVGESPVRITNILTGSYSTPAFSPDGKYIAFTKITQGQFFVGVINSATKEEKLLTSDRYAEGPTWSYNSRQIAYQAKRNGIYQIMFVDVVTGNKRSFTSKKGFSNPYWYKTKHTLKGVIKRKINQ